MKRRQVISAIGGGMVVGTAVGAAKRNPRQPSGPPADQYSGPMISAHEHLFFLPKDTLDDLVDWMDALGWERMVAFSTPPLLDHYTEHPSRFIPFNQAPFSRWALSKLFPDGGRELPALPYLPTPDDSLKLEDLSSEFEASLEARHEWDGIGEISLRLVHRLTGDVGTSRPDTGWLGEICGVARDHDVTLMLHPPHPAQYVDDSLEGEAYWDAIDEHRKEILDALRSLLGDFPKTRFIIHGLSKPLLGDVNPLLENFDNWVYDVSGIMFSHEKFWTGVTNGGPPWTGNKGWVERHFGEDEIEQDIETAFETWKPILTENPERVLWGVDSGRPWHYHYNYFDVHDRLYRGLLGRLPEADAQKIGHVNARRYL